MICTDCGELFEFCDPCLQGIQGMIAEIYDFEIACHAFSMYGRCRRESCLNCSEEEESLS